MSSERLRCIRCQKDMIEESKSDAFRICEGKKEKHPPYLVSIKFLGITKEERKKEVTKTVLDMKDRIIAEEIKKRKL